MQYQQAVCLEVREPAARCPGAGFSVWLIGGRGNRVAAVAGGAWLSLLEMAAPGLNTGVQAAPALGSVLPVFWMPETAWPASLKRWKARHPGKGLRLSRGGH